MLDADVHPRIATTDALYPYLSAGWRDFFDNTIYRITERSDVPSPGEASTKLGVYAGSLFGNVGEWGALLVSLQAGSVNGWIDPVRASALSAAFNDYFLNEWCALDSRFRLAICVAPQDAKIAAAEIERLAGEPAVAAVFLPLINEPLGSRYYGPILAAAEEARLPVLLHPTASDGLMPGAPMFAGGVASTQAARIANSFQVAFSNIASVIFDGALQRYPSLTFIFAEFGVEWIRPLCRRLDSVAERFRGEVALAELPSVSIGSRMAFTFGRSALHDAEALCGEGLEDVLLYGSGYPYEVPAYDDVIRTLGDVVAGKVLQTNASRFIRPASTAAVPAVSDV